MILLLIPAAIVYLVLRARRIALTAVGCDATYSEAWAHRRYLRCERKATSPNRRIG